MANPFRTKVVGLCLAASILVLVLLYALQLAQSNSRFVFWDIMPASDGKYKVELYSFSKESDNSPSTPSLLSAGHVELHKSELHLQIHFNKNRDSCRVGINEWSSKWLELPWMKEGDPNPFEAIPPEIKWNNDERRKMVSIQFTNDPATLVLLRKRTGDREHLLIANFTRE